MPELIPINVVIGDRSYRVKLAPGDEESVRRTLKTINEKVVEFRTQFAGKDMQDYVAMVLLWYATQQGQDRAHQQLSSQLSDSLGKVERQLDKMLNTGNE